MYESIKEQRKKFIEGLKADVSEYRTNILSDEKTKSDCLALGCPCLINTTTHIPYT